MKRPKIADKKPIAANLKSGEEYLWCACGENLFVIGRTSPPHLNHYLLPPKKIQRRTCVCANSLRTLRIVMVHMQL